MLPLGQLIAHFSPGIPIRLVTAVLVIEVKSTVANDESCGGFRCTDGLVCCGANKCCSPGILNRRSSLTFSETWYFWVGIVASILMFLGFLTLCICYLKRSLAMTLSLVQSIPNDMVIIRTVQDPNGIIRPEITRYAQHPRTGKPPPQDASAPEDTNDSMLPLDPAYPPVRAVVSSRPSRVATADRNNQNLADIILPPGYVHQPNGS